MAIDSLHSTGDLLAWVHQSVPSVAIRRSSWAVMALESAHLIGLALLGGPVLIAALAVVRGGGLAGIAVKDIVRGLRRAVGVGLAVLTISGAAIAVSEPYKYYNNSAFRWKMLLFAVALLMSALVFRSQSRIDQVIPPLLRPGAVLACIVWLAVAVCGRLIGFL